MIYYVVANLNGIISIGSVVLKWVFCFVLCLRGWQLLPGSTNSAQLHHGVKPPGETKHQLGSWPSPGPAKSQPQHPNQHGLISHRTLNTRELCTSESTRLRAWKYLLTNLSLEAQVLVFTQFGISVSFFHWIILLPWCVAVDSFFNLYRPERHHIPFDVQRLFCVFRRSDF